MTRIISSHGEILIDSETGVVLETNLDDTFGPLPVLFNMFEWRRRYPGEALGRFHDILDFGFWYRDASGVLQYEEPDHDWRKRKTK